MRLGCGLSASFVVKGAAGRNARKGGANNNLQSRTYHDSLDQVSRDIDPWAIDARPISPYTSTASIYPNDRGIQSPNNDTTHCSTGPPHLEVHLSHQVPSSRHTAH